MPYVKIDPVPNIADEIMKIINGIVNSDVGDWVGTKKRREIRLIHTDTVVGAQKCLYFVGDPKPVYFEVTHVLGFNEIHIEKFAKYDHYRFDITKENNNAAS